MRESFCCLSFLQFKYNFFFWGKVKEIYIINAVCIQQHPDLVFSIGRPWSIFTLLAVSVALDGGPTRFLISAAIVMKACSTLVAFLADVSRNGIPNWLAYSYLHAEIIFILNSVEPIKMISIKYGPHACGITYHSRCMINHFLCS